MASTTVQSNNKLLAYRRDITREYVRGNLFSPYIGSDSAAIIRIVNDLKKGGEQINIPLTSRLRQKAIANGALVGNEEVLDNYGFRAWIDWARNAVSITNSEDQKSSIDLFGEAKPKLEDWGKELIRDEIIDALFAIPSESQPAGLGTTYGQRVNGILFDASTATQRNTWVTDNADRVLFGGATGNLSAGNFGASCGNVTSAMTLSAAMLNKMKRLAKKANPRIRPYMVKDMNREYFLVFSGSNAFRDLQADTTIINANTQARPREGNGMDKNPLFQDGDLLYNGMIIREIPEMDLRCPTFYATAGNSSAPISPVFLCGQSALVQAYGRMPRPTFRKEDDYGFIRGVGVEMAYGIAKVAKKNITNNLKDWAVFTAFVGSATDA